MEKPEQKTAVTEEPAFIVYKPARHKADTPLRASWCCPQPVLLTCELTFVLPLPEPLPDSYFTPTVADLKSAQATLSARTQALTNAPLQLRAGREAEEKAKRDRWAKVSLNLSPLISDERLMTMIIDNYSN